MFQDLTDRCPELEEMDRDDIERGALEGALRSLIRINSVGNGAGIFWPSLRQILRRRPSGSGPLRVLDVGCGGGDLAYRLEWRAARAGLKLRVDGCDRSPVAIEMARRKNAAARASGDFFVLDAIHDELPEGYDVILSSLFLHHMDHDEGRLVLRKMAESAREALLLSDLIRTRFGLFLVYLATRTLSRSPVVHTDGVTSLLAAYSMEEIQDLADSIGLSGAAVERRWPERFLLTWHKS